MTHIDLSSLNYYCYDDLLHVQLDSYKSTRIPLQHRLQVIGAISSQVRKWSLALCDAQCLMSHNLRALPSTFSILNQLWQQSIANRKLLLA